jgi:predicted nucleic acid-binding protein
MILLDTNVIIYASNPTCPSYSWAKRLIGEAVLANGAGINAITLAEFCAGDSDPSSVAKRIGDWGVRTLDVPAAAAMVCAQAFNIYRQRRAKETGNPGPSTPLPDFFIGAHAQFMGWEIATADKGCFATYFPSVPLRTPEHGSE